MGYWGGLLSVIARSLLSSVSASFFCSGWPPATIGRSISCGLVRQLGWSIPGSGVVCRWRGFALLAIGSRLRVLGTNCLDMSTRRPGTR